MYPFFLLYWGVILLFEYLPMLLGSDASLLWMEGGGYEWIKTLWFFAGVSALVIWKLPEMIRREKRLLWNGIWIILFISLSALLYGNNELNWLGTHYLPQGALFWITLTLLALIFTTIEENILKKVRKFLLLSAIPVGLYALAQVGGIDPVKNALTGVSWESWRAFSTFGNPNTLAVFALLLLPITNILDGWKKYLAQAGLFGIILLSGSVSVGIITLLFIIWEIGSARKYLLVGIGIIAVITLLIIPHNLLEEKLLSGSTRVAIWRDI